MLTILRKIVRDTLVKVKLRNDEKIRSRCKTRSLDLLSKFATWLYGIGHMSVCVNPKF